jgi:hypothetical protein
MRKIRFVSGLFFIATLFVHCNTTAVKEIDVNKPVASDSLFLIKSHGKMGLMSINGKEIVAPEYDYISIFIKGHAICQKGEKYGIIDSSGKSTVSFLYEKLDYFPRTDTICIGRLNGKYGLISTSGNIIQPFIFDEVGERAAYNTWFKNSAGYGVFDKNGKILCKGKVTKESALECSKYETEEYPRGQFTIVMQNEKYGLKRGNKWLIKPDFSYISITGFSDGLIPAKRKAGENYVYLDTTGNVAIKGEFYIAEDFHHGAAACSASPGKWGLIDKTGKFILSPEYNLIEPDGYSHFEITLFSDGPSEPEENNLVGYADTLGRMIVSPGKYDIVTPFIEGYSIFGMLGKNPENPEDVPKVTQWGLLDEHGNVHTTLSYDVVSCLSNGLIAVQKDKKWGYIDTNNRIIVPIQFDEAECFNRGLAEVHINNKMAYINKTGKIIWKED